jgi:hypothetical protein
MAGSVAGRSTQSLDVMSDASVIRVKAHRAAIDRILEYYELSPATLELVPSVFEWCQANGVAGDHVDRMAICLCNWNAGLCHIAMCEQFSAQDFANANMAMLCRGFRDELDRVQSNKQCLLHLLLHEIACHVLKTSDQVARDTWAFAEMEKHDI